MFACYFVAFYLFLQFHVYEMLLVTQFFYITLKLLEYAHKCIRDA